MKPDTPAPTRKTGEAHLRSYDLIVRFGGDEYVCGLSDLNMDEVARWFTQVNADLAANQQVSVTVGLAKPEEGDFTREPH